MCPLDKMNYCSRFQNRNMEYMDKHLRAVFSCVSVESWLVFRVQMLGVVMVTGIAILAVVENYIHGIDAGIHAVNHSSVRLDFLCA